ncbi:MAG: hypothetical protein LBD52_02105 [Prevotellaceae bacterium]|jgi:hypothetical protein|nr:hypothetical protein [Prevotellaceae bacterium]
MISLIISLDDNAIETIAFLEQVRKPYSFPIKRVSFDEDYVRACAGEDTDINWQLKAMGLYMKSMKNKAIVYHLHHTACSTDKDTLYMTNIMHQKMKAGRTYCLNGINKQKAS